MYIAISYIVILIYMFRIADEQKKYTTNKDLLDNSPWYYTFGSSHESCDRNDQPSLFDSLIYPFTVLFAPISIVILTTILVSSILYKAIFKWLPNLYRKQSKQ